MVNKDNHIFIVGLPRSGTSIIYRTIQKLPNFRLEKLNLWETCIFQDHISFDTLDLYYPSLLGYVFDRKDFYDSFLESIKKYTDKLGRRNELTPGKYRIKRKCQSISFGKLMFLIRYKLTEMMWKRSYKRKIIQEYFNHVKRDRHLKRIVEKTPRHYLHVHQILWTFPNARIIWMIRHPIEIFTSGTKRAKIDKDFINWNINSFIEEFRNSFHLLDIYENMFKENIILVKYEDFVNDPENKLKKICNLLNEPFSNDSLIISNSEKLKWDPDPYLFSKIVKKTEKNWNDYISIESAKKIEAALQNLMEEYSFEFYTQSMVENFTQ